MSLEWKPDPSPLHLLEGGESAFMGKWKLHIDRMKTLGESKLMDSVLGSLTEKERKVLRMRFGVEGEEAAEKLEREMEAFKENRKRGDKTHPYMWRVDYHGDGTPQAFTGMGGRAATAQEAKELARAAVKSADLAYNVLDNAKRIWEREGEP